MVSYRRFFQLILQDALTCSSTLLDEFGQCRSITDLGLHKQMLQYGQATNPALRKAFSRSNLLRRSAAIQLRAVTLVLGGNHSDPAFVLMFGSKVEKCFQP